MKIAEFFATLGFKVDETGLNQFQDNMTALPKKFAVLAAAALAATYTIDRFVDSSVRGAVALANFSNQTGLSAQELQKWQIAAQMSNLAMSAEEVTQRVQTLQQKITQLQLTGEGAAPFALLGIDPNGGALSVLDQLREKIKGLTRPVAVNLLEQLGLGGDFINVLELSRKEFDAMSGSMIRSQPVQQALIRLGTASTKAKLGFSLWKDELVAKLEPVLMRFLDLIKRVGDALGTGIDLALRLANAIGDLAGSMQFLFPVAAALAFAFFPITAALAALLLILEDVAVYMRGGDSLIGRLEYVWRPFLNDLDRVGDKIDKNIIQPLTRILELIGLLPTELEKVKLDKLKLAIDNADLPSELDPTSKWQMLKTMMPLLQMPEDFIDSIGFLANGEQKASQPLTISNNFNISSNGSPQDVALEVAKTLENQYSYSYDRFNKGLQA